MAKRNRILTIGGSTVDLIFYTDSGEVINNPSDLTKQKLIAFEYGAKVIANESYFTFGGGASNAAVVFSKLGNFSVKTITRIGKDEYGRQIIKNLKNHKIDTSLVQFDEKKGTGFSSIVASGVAKDHIAFLHRGANNFLDLDKFDLDSENFDWIYLTSLSGEKWKKVLDKIISLKRSHFAWNPGEKQIKAGLGELKKYLAKTDILLLNKDEATELVLSNEASKKMGPKWLTEVYNLLKVLGGYGPKVIVITDGKNGAYVWDLKKSYYTKSFSLYEENIVDTTGAGDAFCASFLAGYIYYSGDINKALKLGMVNSAYNLTGVGAQNPLLTRQEAEKLMEE
jgi:ribokinase